jgi:integrase
VVRVIADLPLPWQRLAADLLYDSGARVSEIVVASPAAVDLVREEITLRRKGRHGIKKIAHLPLSAAMTTRLRAWIADLPPDATTLFNVPAARQRLRYALIAACKRLDIPPFTPHGIRRLVSWRLIEAHTNRRLYQEIMGHSFEMGLSTYARATEESRRAIADLLSLRPALYDNPVHPKTKKV